MTDGVELVTEENTDDAVEADTADADTADADTAADMMTGFDWRGLEFADKLPVMGLASLLNLDFRIKGPPVTSLILKYY